jgi:hypothetical protein
MDIYHIRHLDGSEKNIEDYELCEICLTNKAEIKLENCKHQYCK